MSKPHSVRKKFTRRDKHSRTILLCEMLEYHNVFLEAAFRGDGYSFEVLKNAVRDRTRTLRYISNDYCYPTVLIIAQFMEYLESGERRPEEVAFMEPQAGGACRAGNIYNLLQRVLYKKHSLGQEGYDDIPVISLNFSGEEKHPGFRITPRLLFGAIAAVCYGDLIMCLYQQTKPYEVNPGETDRVRAQVEEKLCGDILAHRNGRGCRMRGYRYAVERFRKIPVERGRKRRVGITGEIYMKFSRLGNDDIERFVMEQGFEPYSGGFINYCIYLVDTERYKAERYGKSGQVRGRVEKRAYDGVLRYLCRIQREMYAAVAESGRYETDLDFERLKEKAADLLDYGCNTGDGWLIAAEAAQYAEKGCESVLILHPFGCLVSHVCERGILHKLHRRYPHASIQTIEYDYDQSKTLRESRILLALRGGEQR